MTGEAETTGVRQALAVNEQKIRFGAQPLSSALPL
jgi:hypothetical protein